MAKLNMKQPSSNDSLLDRAAAVLKVLSECGWQEVFKQHGLNIIANDLRSELSKVLSDIDRAAPGFDDFCIEGVRGIEVGRPALSVLWHGLASPHVRSYRQNGKEKSIKRFATPAELEVIENLVYGLSPPSVQGLRAMAGDAPIAIVVFAKEYRPASNTVHRRHADMCFSRTGVARVGTEAAEYLPNVRGYLPYHTDKNNAQRVLPCRYAAYVAALMTGERDTHGPMRFLDPGQLEDPTPPDKDAGNSNSAAQTSGSGADPGDGERRFWVPVHKLFSGAECIEGFDLDIKLEAHHVNEKLRRVHLFFLKRLHDGGWREPDISVPPFRFTDGIAEFSLKPEDGEGLLVPVVHPSLMEIAQYNGEDLTYIVPATDTEIDGTMAYTYSSSLGLRPEHDGARSAPEYVHARFASNWNGEGDKDLNELENMLEIISKGNFRAKHVIDFTGDGWVDVSCPQLSLEIPHRLAAYSIVAPPDYFPAIKQRDLIQWWEQSVPTSIKTTIWPSNPGPPETLSDQRLAANLALDGSGFRRDDNTMTAIVGGLTNAASVQAQFTVQDYRRSSMLPDGAAGVFAPGWDTSYDRNEVQGEEDVLHLAAYGLGSPFPEDAKLCAALSSYWPAVAPDIARVVEPSQRYASATPLTDSTIGQDGSPPWDGIVGPKLIDEDTKTIEYSALAYGDYVKTGLANGFDVAKIGEITPREYIARTVIMARAYQALGATTTPEKVELIVFSFRRVDCTTDKVFRKANASTKHTMDTSNVFRIVLFKETDRIDDACVPFNKVWVKYDRLRTLYADPQTVLEQDEDGAWKAHVFRD